MRNQNRKIVRRKEKGSRNFLTIGCMVAMTI